MSDRQLFCQLALQWSLLESHEVLPMSTLPGEKRTASATVESFGTDTTNAVLHAQQPFA